MPPSEGRLRLSFSNWVVGGTLVVNHPRSLVVSGVVTAKKKSVETSSKAVVALTAANTEANKTIVVEEKRGCCSECNRDCNCKASEEVKLPEEADTADPKVSVDTGRKVTITSGDKSTADSTAEQDALLRSLKAENKSWKYICSQLGMPKHVLHHRYKELMKIDHQAATAAANSTNVVAVMSGANPSARTKNGTKRPQQNISTKATEKEDSEADPFGGLFEEADWGGDSGGGKEKLQKPDRVGSNGDEWREWGGNTTIGQAEDRPHARAVQNGSNGINAADCDVWGWGGDQSTGNGNHAGTNMDSGNTTHGDLGGWGGDQVANNDNNATNNAKNNNGNDWGENQTFSNISNTNGNVRNGGANNNSSWAWGGNQTTNSKIANSYSKHQAPGRSANNDGGDWGWGKDQTARNNLGSGSNWGWGGDQTLNTKIADNNANSQAVGQTSNNGGGDWGWGGAMPPNKNINVIQGTSTHVSKENQQDGGAAKDSGKTQNANSNGIDNTKININTTTSTQYPQYHSYPQVYHPTHYPSLPSTHFLPSYPGPFSHPTQFQAQHPEIHPVPINPLTGRLHADEVWSPRDCAILEFLMSRHASEQWMTMQSGFFNWTGRMVHASIIKAKFERDGVLEVVSGGRGVLGGVGGKGGAEAWAERGGLAAGGKGNNSGGGGNWG